jgi:hypothetical protein
MTLRTWDINKGKQHQLCMLQTGRSKGNKKLEGLSFRLGVYGLKFGN